MIRVTEQPVGALLRWRYFQDCLKKECLMYSAYTPYIRKSLHMSFAGYVFLGIVCIGMAAMMGMA